MNKRLVELLEKKFLTYEEMEEIEEMEEVTEVENCGASGLYVGKNLWIVIVDKGSFVIEHEVYL